MKNLDKIVEKRKQIQSSNEDAASISTTEKQFDSINRVQVGVAKELAKVIVENKPEEVKVPDLNKVVKAVNDVKDYLEANPDDDSKIIEAIQELTREVQKLPKEYEKVEIPDPIEEVTVKNFPDYSEDLKGLGDKLDNLKLDPKINVAAPKVEVKSEPVDLKPLQDSIEALKQAVVDNKVIVPPTDLTALEDAMIDVNQAIRTLKFPSPNYVIPFKDVDGAGVQVQLDADGNLPIAASPSTPAKATDAYGISNIEDTGTYKYFGFEKSDGGWYIMRKTLADNTFLYYAASSDYSTGWTNRATHTYVSYSGAF